MQQDAERWLRALGSELDAQREVMRGLLREALRDPRIRILVVGCSIGRGAADALSDIDALYGVTEADWREAVNDSAALVRRVGDIVDLHQEIITPVEAGSTPFQHTFAQYASGVQIDLVVATARDSWTPKPDWVVLYDPDGRVVGEPRSSSATEAQVRSWMYAALVKLSACAKYLTRGSLWEAKLQLDAARTELWRLWAAAERIPDPQYGLTAVLDAPEAPMPANIERTVATLDRRALRAAALTCAELVMWTWPRAIGAVTDANLGMPPLAEWVRKQLESLPT